MGTDYDTIVIGAGHNGLTCACYLARAGQRVLVLEGYAEVGGASHTAATIPAAPDFRFDTGSVAHNMIQMSTVLDELRLGELGLEYLETDPFMTACLPGGRYLRFYRSVERTCAEIARSSPRDAEAYARFIRRAAPLVELSLVAFRQSEDRPNRLAAWGARGAAALRALARNRPSETAALLAGGYADLLTATFAATEVGAAIAAFGAHGYLGPIVPGTGFFALWQAAYHRYGNWHARGGAGALTIALRRRLEAWGGEVHTGARVRRIAIADGRASGVVAEDGEAFAARRIVAAINPQTTLLDLVGAEHLSPRLIRRIRARHRRNAVQFVVHAALDRLPPWPDAPPDTWRGLQTLATSTRQVTENFLQADAGVIPRDPALYLYTSSAIDPSLAPPGQHTAYIACAAYPARFADGSGWADHEEREAERFLTIVEERAPGFRAGVRGITPFHAERWEREIGLLGGHPMHLDMSLDQIGPFRPLPGLSRREGPLPGLYLSGAGTFPGGGVSGIPGRSTAKRILADG